jgi:hypothetical protein
MADEDPELEAHFYKVGILKEEDETAEDIPPEFQEFWIAWHMLRDDRPLGAMGGCGGIYYTAISRYAEDHEITGSDFTAFLLIVRGMDAEYQSWVAERNATPTPSPPQVDPT